MDTSLIVLAGKSASGKCQPVDTIIPTPNGKKRLGELQVGDKVFGSDGRPTKVLAYFPKGEMKVWQITFEDGRIAYCNDSHIWPVVVDNAIENVETQNLKVGQGIKRGNGTQSKKKKYTVPPYVAGVFLSKMDWETENKGILFSCNETVAARIIQELGEDYCFVTNGEDGYRTLTFKDCPMEYDFHPLLAAKETILERYEKGSWEQRLDFLCGFLSGMSTTDFDGTIYSFKCPNNLYGPMRDFCASLGLALTKEQGWSKIMLPNHFRKLETVDIIPPHQYDTWRDIIELQPLLRILSIKEYKDYAVPMACIYVDAPDHLYITNNYLLTHNTTVANTLVNRLPRTNKIIGTTTRPPRPQEKNGIDYNFVTDGEFQKKIENEDFLEHTSFRGWKYGTEKDAIKTGKINIAVLNPQGIEQLLWRCKFDGTLYLVLLDTSLRKRIIRSIKRDKKLSFEHIRRAFADKKAFSNLGYWLGFWKDKQQPNLETIEIRNNYLTPSDICDIIVSRLQKRKEEHGED